MSTAIAVQGNGERSTEDNISLKTSRFPKRFFFNVNWRFLEGNEK